MKTKQGVQSVEVGAQLLRALVAAPGPMMLKDLAASAKMAPAKAHRYLVSLCRSGLVEQSGSSGLYDLGSFSLSLGLTALGRLAPIQSAEPFLEELRTAIGQTVALADWTDKGPVIVRWLGVEAPVSATLRVGSIMPLTRSATGQAFLAFRPDNNADQLIKEELVENRRRGMRPGSRDELTSILGSARRDGFSFTNDFIPGLSGVAAPVFGSDRSMIFALIALGYTTPFCAQREHIALNVVRTARALSQRLGWR